MTLTEQRPALAGTDDHTHSCPNCDPRLRQSGPRQGAHHYSVRFPEDRPCAVFKDGVQIMDCIEVWCGANGRAIRHHDPAHLCPCERTHDCRYMDYGNFQVRSR